MILRDITLKVCGMSDALKLTPSLLSMLDRIERHSGTLLLLTVTASGGREYSKLNKLRGAGYVVKCDHPSVTESYAGDWVTRLIRRRGEPAIL